MKLLPLLLINLATVGGGLMVYDHMREPAAAPEAELLQGSELRDLQDRLARLESSTEGPMLSAPPPDYATRADVHAAVAKALAKRSPASSGPAASGGGTTTAIAARHEVEGMLAEAEADPTLEVLEQMMAKVEAKRRAEREVERQKRNEERVMRRIDRLELGLDDVQKKEILGTLRTYQQQRREMFEKVREGEIAREDVRMLMESGREALTASIVGIVGNDEDAQKVVQSVSGLDRRRGGQGRAGGGGRAR